jgi:hypothetical protein
MRQLETIEQPQERNHSVFFACLIVVLDYYGSSICVYGLEMRLPTNFLRSEMLLTSKYCGTTTTPEY